MRPSFSIRVLVQALGFLLFLSGVAHASLVSVIPSEVHQGDAFVVFMQVESGSGVPEAVFMEQPVRFSAPIDGHCVGIAVAPRQSKPGTYPVDVTFKGEVYRAAVKIVSREFPVERLTLPERQVTLSPDDARRAREEAARLGKIWPEVSEVRWTWPFQLPVEGRMGTRFGTRRILNGVEKNPHNGTDIKAPKGTPVRAITSGRVVLRDELFFGGNTLVIDHGGGLFSFYMHLDEFRVNEGDSVSNGTPVATVGSSGRSTGPHLHVGMKLNGDNVNPLSLVDLKLP